MKIVHLDSAEDREKLKVKVDKSTIITGMGLFAHDGTHGKSVVIFKKGDKICPYLGEEISTAERKKRYGNKWGPYVYFKPYGHPSIDAQYYRSAAAYANDGAWIYENGEYRKRIPSLVNSYLKKGWLIADTDIKNGDEIFLDYGESYWKNLYTGEKSATQKGGGFKKEKIHTEKLTPVQKVGEIYVKRDDLYEYAGVRGGKVRSCRGIVEDYILKNGSKPAGLVTGGSRSSPQGEIVAHIGMELGIPVHLHLPQGSLPDVLKKLEGDNVKIFQHFPGFNHVLSHRASTDAKNSGFLEIPFGMISEISVKETSRQVANIPFSKIKRIVVPVGSGVTLSGILWGLEKLGKKVPVLGVVVGADPELTLDTLAPKDWRERVVLKKASVDYHKKVDAHIGDIQLDPVYEGKTFAFLENGDLLWVVGLRKSDKN